MLLNLDSNKNLSPKTAGQIFQLFRAESSWRHQKRSDEKCIIPSFRPAAGSVGAERSRVVFPRGLGAISSPALFQSTRRFLIKENSVRWETDMNILDQRI